MYIRLERHKISELPAYTGTLACCASICLLDIAVRRTLMPQSTQALPDADRRPKVGVGVFVVNQDGHFLMGKRKGSNGAGQQSFEPL